MTSILLVGVGWYGGQCSRSTISSSTAVSVQWPPFLFLYCGVTVNAEAGMTIHSRRWGLFSDLLEDLHLIPLLTTRNHWASMRRHCCLSNTPVLLLPHHVAYFCRIRGYFDEACWSSWKSSLLPGMLENTFVLYQLTVLSEIWLRFWSTEAVVFRKLYRSIVLKVWKRAVWSMFFHCFTFAFRC